MSGGSSTAAVLIYSGLLLLTQPGTPTLLMLSTDLRCLHEATQRCKGVLSPPVAFPVGLGSQVPTVQESDKNRHAPRRLRRHYSETGSSGLLRAGVLGKRQHGVASLGQQEPVHKAVHKNSERFT